MLSVDSDCLADRHRGFPREKGGEVMEAAPTAPTARATWPQGPASPHLDCLWLVDNSVANQDGIILLCCEIQGTSFAVLTY